LYITEILKVFDMM